MYRLAILTRVHRDDGVRRIFMEKSNKSEMSSDTRWKLSGGHIYVISFQLLISFKIYKKSLYV